MADNPPPQRPGRLGRSPFGTTFPAIVMAALYAAAAMLWIVAGDWLPGGRWLAVHLFTLGVLTNVVLAFTEHFGRTLTRAPDKRIRWQPAVTNAGILLVLAGLPGGIRWMVGLGATIVTAVVLVAYVRLRRMRKAAVGARFVWIVRTYERAHGAFIHGAILGVLLGLGLLPGTWYLAGRIAHLHINILGWGGLTLLATLVFFGPTLVRTRIIEGADARAAVALRHGATGLTIGVLALLATGIAGTAGIAFRLLGAAGLAVFAWAAVVTCIPVARAAHAAAPSAPRWPTIAVSLWLPVVAWADVAVVALGRWRLLDALGLTVLVGVLAQAIATVVVYVLPMLRGRTFGARDQLLARFERLARTRTAAFNIGVAAVVAAAAVPPATAGASVAARIGWALVIAALLQLVATAVLPVRAGDDQAQVASSVARRHRHEAR